MIVLQLAKKIAATVTVDVEKRRDSMNILSYVHIKKVFADTDIPRAEVECVILVNMNNLDNLGSSLFKISSSLIDELRTTECLCYDHCWIHRI